MLRHLICFGFFSFSELMKLMDTLLALLDDSTLSDGGRGAATPRGSTRSGPFDVVSPIVLDIKTRVLQIVEFVTDLRLDYRVSQLLVLFKRRIEPSPPQPGSVKRGGSNLKLLANFNPTVTTTSSATTPAATTPAAATPVASTPAPALASAAAPSAPGSPAPLTIDVSVPATPAPSDATPAASGPSQATIPAPLKTPHPVLGMAWKKPSEAVLKGRGQEKAFVEAVESGKVLPESRTSSADMIKSRLSPGRVSKSSPGKVIAHARTNALSLDQLMDELQIGSFWTESLKSIDQLVRRCSSFIVAILTCCKVSQARLGAADEWRQR